MSRMRCLMFFARQRRNTATTAGGTVEGSAVQSGSFSTTAAMVSVMLSPLNARCPLSISKSTAPNAQMSPRLSTTPPRACSGLM